MSVKASQDPDYLPPNDFEWDERVQNAKAKHCLNDLPIRGEIRPAVFGLIPHRQIEDVEREGSDRQKVSLKSNEHTLIPLHILTLQCSYLNRKSLTTCKN